jgi:hypothetical protein
VLAGPAFHGHTGSDVARSTWQFCVCPPPLTTTFTVLVPLKVIVVRNRLTGRGPSVPSMSITIVPEVGQASLLVTAVGGRTRLTVVSVVA